MYGHNRHAGYSSSSSDIDSDYSGSSDDEDDDDTAVTTVTINGKRITTDEAASRLGNIQIGSGRCLVVGGDPTRHHRSRHKHEHHKGRKREKSEPKHEYIDPMLTASKSDFDIVANGIGKHWKKLARELGLSRGLIEAVSIDFHAEGSYEQAYQSLRKWSQKHANSAKLVDLVTALRKLGLEEICTKLGK